MDDSRCPVCDLPLDFSPWIPGVGALFEICPRCGIQFGYDDCAGGKVEQRPAIYAQWRERWEAAGRPERFRESSD